MATRQTPAAKKVPVKAASKRAAPRCTKPVVSKVVPSAPANPPVEEAVTSVAADKQKLVRDSFTMPKREYEELGALKLRLIRMSHAIKKGELLRAGVAALVAMSDGDLIVAVERVQRLKTGRPKNAKAAGRKAARKKV